MPVMYDDVVLEHRIAKLYRGKKDGRWYENESGARYDACTHRPCEECGEPAEKYYTACPACREKEDRRRYLDRPIGKWDGRSMLYSVSTGRYYQDMDEAEGVERLVICERVVPYSLDIGRWYDQLAEEDTETLTAIEALVEEFNNKLSRIVSETWEPAPCRI